MVQIDVKLDLDSLREGYRTARFSPADVIREVHRRIRAHGERPVWIHVIPEEEAIARAESLGSFRDDLPLYGVPFAIKDNIDLAGVPTTAGCPEYAYDPAKSASVVERLMAAGAIPVGKTNLDQFATGLVGTRSPYGACSSVFDARYISGGSSSGSAVAVALGLASFSLGTDTAGSGRVPAAFNEIVGLKATKGALSTSGVVPACRTLDCVSIFAQSSADASTVFAAARGFDPTDPWSRRPGQPKAWPAGRFRFGVPGADWLRFFGDESAPALFEVAAARLEALGGARTEFDYRIFHDAAQLLYSGPWVAERFAAIRKLAEEKPEALHPVTAQIILKAGSISAVSAFEAVYRLAELTRASEREWERMDFMLLPTAGNCYTHEQIASLADRPQHGSRLLHELREPARSRGHRHTGRAASQWDAVRRDADRARMVRRSAYRDGESFRRSEGGAAVLSRGICAAGCLRRASDRPATESSVDERWRVSDRRLPDNRELPALCAGRHETAEAGAGFFARRRGFDRGRSVGGSGKCVRVVRQRCSGTARDRELHARKREDSEVVCVRAVRTGRCARHHQFRRLESFLTRLA